MILIPGLIESPTGLKDNTIKFTVRCNELPPEKIGQLFMLNQKFVYIGIKEEEFKNEELAVMDQLKSNEVIGKTDSERLRSVLFLAWKDKSEGFTEFSNYYHFKMNKAIEHIKAKLPEI